MTCVPLGRHRLGELVAGGQHDVPGADHRPARRPDLDARRRMREAVASTGAYSRAPRARARSSSPAVSLRGSSARLSWLTIAPVAVEPVSLAAARAGVEIARHKSPPPAGPPPRPRARPRRAGRPPGRATAAPRVGSAIPERRDPRPQVVDREPRPPPRRARPRSRPIAAASRSSGVSISNCTSAVVAAVEPSIGPRRSISITACPAAVSASATIAPEMPMPTTSTSARRRAAAAPPAPAARGRRPRPAARSAGRAAGSSRPTLSSGFRMHRFAAPLGPRPQGSGVDNPDV